MKANEHTPVSGSSAGLARLGQPSPTALAFDARLRDAAYELYDALEKAQAIVERADHRDVCEYDDGGECSCGLWDAEYAMQCALAKARGEISEVESDPDATPSSTEGDVFPW